MCALLEAVASTLQYVAEEIGGGSNSLCINVLRVPFKITISVSGLSSYKGNIFLNAKQ